MKIGTVNGRVNKFTDDSLRGDLSAGLKHADIARKYGCSRAAISKRVNRLGLTTIAAVVAPHESRRFVRENLDALEQLTRSLEKVNLLMDACDRWLRDPNDESKYDLSPRSSEVDVHYEVEVDRGDKLVTERRKKVFSELCSCIGDGRDEDGARFVRVIKGEYRIADTRDLILKTVQESRQIVVAAADLARMLADMKAMQAFREALLAEIAKVSPEVAGNIAQAVQHSIVLSGSLSGTDALPSGRIAIQ